MGSSSSFIMGALLVGLVAALLLPLECTCTSTATGSCLNYVQGTQRVSGGALVVVPSSTTTFNNQSVVDMVHSALNNTFLLFGSSLSYCSYYPSVYIASNTSCTNSSSSSFPLVAFELLQNGKMYIRAGATSETISAAFSLPTDPTDSSSIIFDSSNVTHLNGSGGYMGAVCADHWGSDLLLHYVASLLSSRSDVEEAFFYPHPTNTITSTDSGSTATAATLAAVLNDDSLNSLYSARVIGGGVNASTPSNISTIGAVWGLLFDVVSSLNDTSSAASVTSTFVSTSTSSSMRVPWYGWVAFAFGGLFAIGFLVVLCVATLRIYQTWDTASKADFGQIARESRLQLEDALRNHWWRKDEHPSSERRRSADWVGATWSPTRSRHQQQQRTPTTAHAEGHTREFPLQLNSVIALLKAPMVERLRRALTSPQDLVEEANDKDGGDSCVIELDGRRRKPITHTPLNKGMLVAQQLGEKAVFKTFVQAYKDDQAKMYATLGRQGPVVTRVDDDGVEQLVGTGITSPAASPSQMYTAPAPINAFLDDRITLPSPTSSSRTTGTDDVATQPPISAKKILVRGFPTVVPLLLLSVALLFCAVAVLLLAVGVETIEHNSSHTAVVMGYMSPACDQSLFDPSPKQAWFVAVSDTCKEAEMVGVSRALAPSLFMKASCQLDAATSTSRLTVSMGETSARCEAAPSKTISTQLLNTATTSSSGTRDYCVSSDTLLGGPLQLSSAYLTGMCVPTIIASNTLSEMHRRRSMYILGDGSKEVMSSIPFDFSTEGFNPNEDLVRVRVGNEESPLFMRPYIAAKTIGFVSPVIDEVGVNSSTAIGALTTPLITVKGERPVESFEHSGTRKSSTLSARGFSFSHSVTQNATNVHSNGSLSNIIPLVQSPLRFLGVDGTVFDLGLHTQFTLNFWMRANRQTRGFIFAVANDWHAKGGSSNVILDALSYSISRGTGSSLLEGFVGNRDFKLYSAVALDGPTSLLSLIVSGEGARGGNSVSWDLTLLKGLDGRSALDGEWHMMTIQSDVKSGWRYFHLLVDSQTSYADPAWHQCTSSDGAFSAAVPQGANLRAPSSIANVSRTRTGATVAYVGYGFGGGASVAALQIFTKSTAGDAALRKLASPSMPPSLSGLLILAVVLFGVVLIGALIAIVQVVYRSRVETAKQSATFNLSKAETVQLQLATRARAKKAGRKAVNTAVSAGVQMSKMYSVVRQLSVENGSAASRLRTIYPQFSAVCQAMAIYLASWGWPDIFYEFATALTFLFSFNFDLAFPSIPSIAMPLAQIILCGMLLVLAVFLVIHDQKQFYLSAIGATAFLKKDEDEKDVVNIHPSKQHQQPPSSPLPDNYDFFLDCKMYDQPPIAVEKQRYDPIGPLHKAPNDPFETNGFVVAVTGRGEDEMPSATSTSTKTGDSDQQTPSRMLDIRPHTRFRLIRKSFEEKSGTGNKATTTTTTNPTDPIYTFALLKTNRHGAKSARNGVGWYEWRCSEGIVYTPRARGRNNNDSGSRLLSDSPCFSLRISELLAALQKGDKSAVGNILDSTYMSSSTDLALSVYLVRGSHERATASNPNWHASSIPDLHAGMPPPSSLATYAFEAFIQAVSLSAHHAGLHLERGTLKFVKDPNTQSYTFEFHCIEIIRGQIGQSSELPQPQANPEEPNAIVYTVAPERDRTTRCPRHLCPMIPYRRSFHSECTICSNSYHKDCAAYLRTDGRKCSGTISLVCKEENCGYCLCADGCAGKVGLREKILQHYHGYVYLFWHTNINYILGFFILILGQSLFLPVVQSASMIATCHVDYQCDFPRCYEQMSTKYGVSLYFAFLALVLTLSVMIPFFTFMLVKRKLFLLENRLVDFEGDYESMSLLSRILVAVNEEQWDLFLLSDSSILRALYEMYEFRYIAIHGLLLLFKVFLLFPVLFMPRNSVGQLALAGGVEVGLLLLLTVTDAFINPWMDALARVGSFHQILQVALVALSRVLEDWASQIGIAMICVSVVYIMILLLVIVHEIVLPYLSLRRLRAEETELFRVRNLALKWLELSDAAVLKEGLTAPVLISEYFTADVLSGKTDPLFWLTPLSSLVTGDVTPSSIKTAYEKGMLPPEHQIFEKVERELLRRSQASLAESSNPLLEQISVPYTHLINKAIRTTPNDPHVYTALAERLQRILFVWERLHAIYRESKPWGGADSDSEDTFMFAIMFTSLDKDAYQHFKIEESDEKKCRRRRRFYESTITERIISSESKPGAYHNRCPCVYVHGRGYLSLLELKGCALETSPMDANLCAEAASSLIEFKYSGETISIGGEDLSVAELLARAVERAPDDISHKRKLVDYLCLRAELFAKAGMPVKSEVVSILEEECDVLRICEIHLERSPNSAEAYILLAQTMARCQSVHLLKPTPASTSPPTATPPLLDPSSASTSLFGVRDVYVHGRVIHYPKEVLLFAIEILGIIDADLLITLAETLIHEENQSWHVHNNNNPSPPHYVPIDESSSMEDLGVVSMLNLRKCSAVDVLTIALVAHPNNHRVYTALQASLKRSYTFLRSANELQHQKTSGDVVSLCGGTSTISMPESGDDDKSADPYNSGYSVVDDESLMQGGFVYYAEPIIEPAFYGEYSQAVVGLCGRIGRNTNIDDHDTTPGDDTSKRDVSASWVMARFGWVNIIDIAAAEYLQNCERRSEVFDQLTRLKELLNSRFKGNKKCKPHSYSIKMGIQRHPQQAQRCTHKPLPELWSFKEVVEHAIFLHPDYNELYLMLFEWCLEQPGVIFGNIRIVLPMSEARLHALNDEKDDTVPDFPSATTVSISDIWGVLLEHDWGNPAAYVALSKYCEVLAYQRNVKYYQQALEMSIPVYFPAAALSLLPPSSRCANENSRPLSYLVKLNAVGALTIALHITPRDLTLYAALEDAMHREELRRRYLAYRSIRGKKGLCDLSQVVDKHFQPNSGGLICLIPFLTEKEAIYCNVHDIVCLAAEMCGQALRRHSITSAANMKTFTKVIPIVKRMGVVESVETTPDDARSQFGDSSDHDVGMEILEDSIEPFSTPSPANGARSSFTVDALCRLLFGCDTLTSTTSQLLDLRAGGALDLHKPTPTTLSQDLQQMVVQVHRVATRYSFTSQSEVIRRMYYLQLIVLGARQDNIQFANLLHCRFRLFGQSLVGPAELKMTFLTHSEVRTLYSPSKVEVNIDKGGKGSDENSYNKYGGDDYSGEVEDSIPLVGDETEEERVRRPIVLKSPLTPAQRHLYSTCNFAVDERGSPFHRTEEAKNQALLEGCAVTLLISESELQLYVEALRATRKRFKQLLGEESGGSGEDLSEWEG